MGLRKPGFSTPLSVSDMMEDRRSRRQQIPVNAQEQNNFELDKIVNKTSSTNNTVAGEQPKPGPTQSNTTSNIGAGAQIAQLGLQGQGEKGDVASSTLAGLSAGAMTGNPMIAAVGAGVGLVGGIAASRARKKREKAAAEQRKFENIANIHQKAGAEKNQALENIMVSLGRAFTF